MAFGTTGNCADVVLGDSSGRRKSGSTGKHGGCGAGGGCATRALFPQGISDVDSSLCLRVGMTERPCKMIYVVPPDSSILEFDPIRTESSDLNDVPGKP